MYVSHDNWSYTSESMSVDAVWGETPIFVRIMWCNIVLDHDGKFY